MEYIEEFYKDEFGEYRGFRYTVNEYIESEGNCRINYLLNLKGFKLFRIDYYKDSKLRKKSYYDNGKLEKEVIYYE